MEKTTLDELKAAAYWTAVNYQQQFYETSGDWNEYKPDEHMYIRKYISYALYGPPEYDEECDDENEKEYIYKEEGAMPLIESIFTKIVEHGVQMTESKEVLCSILYNCVYDDSSLAKTDDYQLHEVINIVPLFKIQKNIKKKDVIERQIWYIDTEARIYKNWRDYVNNNNLPTCTMISPKDGIYQADLKEVWSDQMSSVWLETNYINTSRKLINALDITSTLVNVGCIGVGIAAIFNPISAPIMIAGAVGGAASGAWGGGRAVGELVDRGTHDQSISILHREAIPAWLGVAGNTLGLAASGGSALLSRAIRTGTTVGKSAQLAHDAILIGNLFVNSIGVGYNSLAMIQKYRETGEVSTRDVFFLTAHVLFVCNSAVKMKLASEIIKTDQNQILQDYEESLRSNRHRKEFRRLVRNTSSNVVDEVHRNEQIIRSLTKIDNKDEFFATMVQNRKMFASSGTQMSFAEGNIQINGVTLINPSTLASMSKDSILTLINQSAINPSSNPLISEPSTSTATQARSMFMSDNALKAGASALRNFFVQKAVMSAIPVEAQTPEYTSIINDLQYIPDMGQIFKLLLQTGQLIVRKCASEQRYTEEEKLADATNFVWDMIKINCRKFYPGIDKFDSTCRPTLHRITKAFYRYVQENQGEWAKAYLNWNSSREHPENSESPSENLKQNLFENPKSDRFQDSEENPMECSKIVYNGIEMLDPMQVMGLSQEVSTLLIEESLVSTGSSMNGKVTPPKEMINLCTNELNDFFAKHPTALTFKLSDLSNELKGILLDLRFFNKKDIIFYKLLAISMNITQKMMGHKGLEKEVLVDVMNFLWVFVNMNFSQIMPNICMFNNEFESFVMNIVIALYRYQIDDPTKWSSAFYEYRFRYGKS